MSKTRNITKVTRIESFSAAHRLYSTQLTDKENVDLYGKCSNKSGHGHNYKVEVTLQGPVDPVNGMVVNLSCLKVAIWEVLNELDHKNLDVDVSYFKDRVSTVENISIYIWNKLMETELLKDTTLLYKVKVHESDKNKAIYNGKVETTDA